MTDPAPGTLAVAPWGYLFKTSYVRVRIVRRWDPRSPWLYLVEAIDPPLAGTLNLFDVRSMVF